MTAISGFLPLVGWFLGFGLTVASLGYAIRHFRITRAMSYIERMNSSDMAEIRSAIDEWLDAPGSDADKFREISRDPHLSVKLKIFVDIITELGVAYRYRSVSRFLVREIWYPFIPSYWKKLQFYYYAAQLNGTRTGYWFRYLAEEIGADASRRESVLERRYRVPEQYFSAQADAFVSVEELRSAG